MRKIICGALMSLSVTAAGAQQAPSSDVVPRVRSANFILQHCKNSISDGKGDRDPFFEGVCTGIVIATSHIAQNADISADAFSGPGKSRALKEHWTCIELPTGVTTQQVRKVIIKYL